jgi:hypothetical protein
MATKQLPSAVAAQLVAEAKQHGFSVTLVNTAGTYTLTVSKHFEPGDNAAYVACDQQGPHLLALCPATGPGSVWGSDGSGVGGHVAKERGYYELHKSGCSKRVLNHLLKQRGVFIR